MSKIGSSLTEIRQALNGPRGQHTVEKHPGLYLFVRGDGNGSFRIRYRPQPGAQQRWFTLTNDAKGASLATVYKQAGNLLNGVKVNGVDPQAAREEASQERARNTYTLNSLFEDWLEQPREEPLRPRTREAYLSTFRLHVKPYFGKMPIAEITKPDLRARYEKLVRTMTDMAKGTRGVQAMLALRLIKSVMQWAVDRDLLDRNPSAGIDLGVPNNRPGGKRTRSLTDEELRLVWQHGADKLSATNWRIVQLSILLGRRISELAGAQKIEFTLDDEPRWLIAVRQGNKSSEASLVPLPPMALQIIQEAWAASGPSPYLFPQRGHPEKATTRHGPSQAYTDFRREIGIVGKVTMHDARTLLNSRLAAMGVPREYRSHVLHHTGDMRSALAGSTYDAYDYMPEKRRALELWQARLIEIVEGRSPSGSRWQS